MDDQALLDGFESVTLPPAAFTHREHVRVAWLYLARGPEFEDAALAFCKGLRRYAAAHGKAGLYHETITWAFLALIAERRHAAKTADFEAFARANADLFAKDAGALAALYDPATLRSEKARAVFLLPR